MTAEPSNIVAATGPRIAEMEPWEARRILRGCDRADQALLEVEVAIETGKIYAAAAAITYPDAEGAPLGKNARLRRAYWRRIISAKVRDDFWEAGQVTLPAVKDKHRKIELRGIRLNGADVRLFAARYDRGGGGRVDAEVVGHLPEIDRNRRVDKEADWDAFWLEIIGIARAGKLSPGYYRSQATLAADIRAALGSRLSRNTIDPKVSYIWKALMEPDSIP